MKISLITVSYNSEETIRETFESVRWQKIEGFELEYIHVDGLSNDATMEISQEFDDIITKRISEKDSGIYNAMNKGVHLATGDIIGFLNSDDTFYDTNILYLISQYFLDYQPLDIVYGDINYVDNNGSIKRRWRTGERDSFKKGWHPAHPGFYASKKLFDNYGVFNEDLRIAADFDLMLRFMENDRTTSKYLPKVCVNMKLGGESNRSLYNIYRGNREILKAFKLNKIRPVPWYTIKRFSDKIFQKVR
ncbi:MAG: glycosyltransferase family 2 protein [Bacteroidia bacterium]